MTGRGLHHKRVGKVVVCTIIETGQTETFKSITAAAKATGIDKRRIHRIVTEGGQVDGLAFTSPDPDYQLPRHQRDLKFTLSGKLAVPALALCKHRRQTLKQFVIEAVQRHVEYLTPLYAEKDKLVKALEHEAHRRSGD